MNQGSQMKMSIPGPLLEGEFLHRPNRFLSRIRLNGREVWSHVPDPGRLKELLIPGAKVLLEKKPGANRKTKYATVMVYQGEELVSINSLLPNRFARFCMDNQLIPELLGWRVKKAEASFGESRFDFLLEMGSRQKVVEVKSVTLVEDGLARFPDAVTSRGARHVKHLSELINEKRSTAVLFLVQRSDAKRFEPHWERDPHFAETLAEAAAAGVEVLVYTASLNERWMALGNALPINLEAPADE